MLKSELRLSEEQYSEIETLAAANYAPRSIAKYLGVNETHFIKEWKINTSLVRHHYDKGLLEAEFLLLKDFLPMPKVEILLQHKNLRK